MRTSVYVCWASADEVENSSHPDKKNLLISLRQRNHCCLKARLGGICGPTVGLISYRTYKDKMRITSVWVEEGYRRRGIGTALITHLIGKLERHATRESIRFNCCESLTELHHFLGELGFRGESVIHSVPARYIFAFYKEQIQTLATPEILDVR